jgi:hypothetical protein
VYDPSPLIEVDALEIGPRGVVGRRGDERVPDVHHADHPDTRNRGGNALSLLPWAHYARMRQRYGDHLVDGVAGESLLLDTPGPWAAADLAGDLGLETAEGDLLPLTGGSPASPCVEFARFCLRSGEDDRVRTALEDLDGGTRGFYVLVGGSGTVQAGARLWRLA